VVFVTEGQGVDTIRRLAEHLKGLQASSERTSSVSIDMLPVFIKGSTSIRPTLASPSTRTPLKIVVVTDVGFYSRAYDSTE
jgi:hypothetical protein